MFYTGGLVRGTGVDRLLGCIERYIDRADLDGDGVDRDSWLEGLCDAVAGDLHNDSGPGVGAAMPAIHAGRIHEDRVAAWTLPRVPKSAGRDGLEAAPRMQSLTAESGRGLWLVNAFARWGARYTTHGKCIWAALDVKGRRRLPALTRRHRGLPIERGIDAAPCPSTG